jgi:hypothetical protein
MIQEFFAGLVAFFIILLPVFFLSKPDAGCGKRVSSYELLKEHTTCIPIMNAGGGGLEGGGYSLFLIHAHSMKSMASK